MHTALTRRSFPVFLATLIVSLPCVSRVEAQQTAQFSLRPTRSCEISTLVVYETPSMTVGRCEPVKVTVNPDDSNTFRVGIYEDEVGGTGHMWRAAAWMSAAAAALLTNFSPATRHVTFEVNGLIDGPSAGGIMTIGVLAAARGDNVRSDAAMTGMINPDFSIGPVGGIPHKIQGAVDAGKKIVLIPAVSRVDFDKNLGKEVDLIDLGKKLGIEVRPVSDIYEAYRILTTRDLPRLSPAFREPQLKDAVIGPLKNSTTEWLLRHKEARTQFENLPDETKSDSGKENMQLAIELAESAELLTREGDYGGANRCAFEAGFLAIDSKEAARLSEVYQNRGIEQTIKDAESNSAWGQIDLAVSKLKGVRPKNLHEASCYMNAMSNFIEAINYCILADELLKKSKAQAEEDAKSEKEKSEDEDDDFDQALEYAVEAGIYYQYSKVDLLGMDEALEDMSLGSGPEAPSNDRIALAAELFRRVAAANLSMFESMHIEPVARKEGTTAEAIQLRMMDQDLTYAQLKLSLRLLQVLRKQFGDGPEMSYATLTAMRDAYATATTLIARHYQLQTVESDEGIVGVRRERTLRTMLDFADDQARRSIVNLQKHGLDASHEILYYQAARMKRDRTIPDKIDALSYYWAGHMSAQILAFLGDFGSPTE